ncbi:hypothetical protein HMPREF1436_01378 [Helicobacter pylori GAMchJs136i]|nr:hypothetical protein HMPREF1436_01378 [Helicobacter pylori GAMchJs136i]
MLRENGANWKNSYAICFYKESKSLFQKIKRQNILTKRIKYILKRLKDNDANDIIINL